MRGSEGWCRELARSAQFPTPSLNELAEGNLIKITTQLHKINFKGKRILSLHISGLYLHPLTHTVNN